MNDDGKLTLREKAFLFIGTLIYSTVFIYSFLQAAMHYFSYMGWVKTAMRSTGFDLSFHLFLTISIFFVYTFQRELAERKMLGVLMSVVESLKCISRLLKG